MAEQKKKSKKLVGKLRNRIMINGFFVESGTEVEVTDQIKEYIDPKTIKEAQAK